MTRYFTEEAFAETVNARMEGGTDPRLAEVMSSLVRHLRDFIEETQLTQAEWDYGLDFLTRTGQLCSAERQEFILLSDVLGFSMLIDAINNRRPAGATENTVFGPFHVADAPILAMGTDICLDGKGESCLFIGTVVDPSGQPIAGACLDVWSDNAEGFYDVQQPELQPRWNNRGRFITAADGRYGFRGIKPTSYPIPDDGPVGSLLTSLGRHPYRPAHTHFLVTAPGFQRLVTHTFVAGDTYLDSDAVFGVKESLIVSFERLPDADTEWQCTFDFVLAPA
jgi:hydroxyquinol 1,2-dioxygenase